MIPLFKVAMSKSAPALVEKVLLSGFVGQGPKVEEFERALTARIGNPKLATVNSATSGLHLALHLVTGGVAGGGGEVLTTPMTCTPTNLPLLADGLPLRGGDVGPAAVDID